MVAICIGVGALLVYVVDRQLLKLIGFRRLMLIERGLLLIGLLWAIYHFYTGSYRSLWVGVIAPAAPAPWGGC